METSFRSLACFNFALLLHTNLISFQNESWQSLREVAEEVGVIAVKMPMKLPNPQIIDIMNSKTFNNLSTLQCQPAWRGHQPVDSVPNAGSALPCCRSWKYCSLILRSQGTELTQRGRKTSPQRRPRALDFHLLHFTLFKQGNIPNHNTLYFPQISNQSRGYFCYL